MTLMLNSGASAVNTPAPTDTHVPVLHHEIVELVRFTFALAGKLTEKPSITCDFHQVIDAVRETVH
jgi:hypothetical protein